MDLQAYISSGILEAYVLGNTSAGETAEVERMAAQHPEVRAEIEAIEIALEEYAMQNAVAPSTDLFAAFEDKLPEKPEKTAAAPSSPASSGFSVRNILGIGLLICIGALAFLFGKYQNRVEEKQVLQQQLNQLQEDCDAERKAQEEQNVIYAQLADPTTEYILLEGTERFPTSEAKLFVNAEDQTVLINPTSLPKPGPDQQYQLWAIVANQGPTSLGLLDIDFQAGELQNLAFAENAQAYAITLEPLGGSPGPTLEMMHVSNI